MSMTGRASAALASSVLAGAVLVAACGAQPAAVSTPRPPPSACRWYAPTCGAIRPATSDMGASSGSEPSGACTVS